MPAKDQESLSRQPSQFAHAGLVVVAVTGVHTSVWQMVNGDVMVQLHTFQEALVRSLSQSGIFGSVSDGGVAEYELHAEIMRQDKAVDGATLSVRYVLRDASLGRDVFAQEINTSSSISEDTALGASLVNSRTAISRAAFRAAGKNIDSLMTRLRAIEAP